MARLIDAFTQIFDDAGDPLIAGKLYFYESGTNNTEKATFADVTEVIPNSNPVLLDGAGRCPNVFGSGSYKILLTDSDDVQIQVFDPVSPIPSGDAFSLYVDFISYEVGALVTGPDGNYYRSLQSGNVGNDPASSPTFWQRVDLATVFDKLQYTFADDADATLTPAESSFSNIEIQNGVITQSRTITVSGQSRLIYINNLNDFDVTVAGPSQSVLVQSNTVSFLLYDQVDVNSILSKAPVKITELTVSDPAWVPSTGVQAIDFLPVAGGGGGGGTTGVPGALVTTTGGGGGGWCRKTTYTIDASYSIVVGAGGARGETTLGTVNGSAGGDTTVSSASLSLTAEGGLGGVGYATGSSIASPGASGGGSSGGDENGKGSPSTSRAFNGFGSEFYSYSSSGGSFLGGGVPSEVDSSSDGVVYGEGGGGTGSTGGGVAGGNGAGGVVFIKEYF